PRHTGDEIDFALGFGRIVNDDVTVSAPPLRTRRPDIETAHQFGGKYRAIGDTTLVNWRIGSNHNIANDRMHAVCTDHSVRFGVGPVPKTQTALPPALIHPDHLL